MDSQQFADLELKTIISLAGMPVQKDLVNPRKPLEMAKRVRVTFRPLPRNYGNQIVIKFREKLENKLKEHGVQVIPWDEAAELPAGTNRVMTGRPFPEDHPAAAMIRDNNLYPRVMHLGYRSPLEIRALFQGCLALVFPSLFEGYGMPVAEAIVAGKPVLCSNATSLPELAGEAALTFDPHSVEDIANALLDVATKADLRSALAREARRRRPLFSAQRSAIQTMSIYQRVHNQLYSC